MKLLYCPTCGDIFNLTLEVKKCSCGKTQGYYTDMQNAVYTSGIPIGFSNLSFEHAVIHQPKEGAGANFIAFVIPSKCKSMEKL